MTFVAALYAFFVLGLATLSMASVLSWLNSFSRVRTSCMEIAVFAFLIAPVVVSFVLWVGMLAFPGKVSPLGYVFAMPMVLALISAVLRPRLAAWCCGVWLETAGFCRSNGISRRWVVAFIGLVVAFFGFAFVWSNIVTCYHIDMSEYILAGDYFARVRDVSYHGLVVDPENGFWLHAYHSYCLPLFAAWGVMMRQVLGGQEDWYYRFLMLYYLAGLNAVASLFLVRRKMGASRWLVAGVGLLTLNFMPFIWRKIPFTFDCDLLRVSLIMACVWVLLHHLRRPQWGTCLFLGVLGSAAMASHGTSVFFVAILYSTLLFSDTDWKTRAKHLIAVALLILSTWGLHYILQVFWGDGWVFGCGAGEVVAEAVESPVENTDGPWAIFLNFPQALQFFVTGFLGQIFDVSHFSIVFVFIIWGGILFLRRPCRIPDCHRMLLVSLVGIYCIIAFWLNFNFRYRFTLVPLLLVVAFRLIMDASDGIVRISRKKLLCMVMVVVLTPVVLTMVLAKEKMSQKTHLAKSDSHQVESNAPCGQRWPDWVETLILSRLRPSRPDPLWPEWNESSNPRIVFSDVSKIAYRTACRPVWFCDKFSAIVGPMGPCRLGADRLARAFDYFVMRDQMQPEFIPEAFVREDWRLVGCANGYSLYRSRLRSANSAKEGSVVR